MENITWSAEEGPWLPESVLKETKLAGTANKVH